MTSNSREYVVCDQCSALMINGAFCHEIGCPNSHSRYDIASGECIKQERCFECGELRDKGELCCYGA